jgi:hypothetical protein
MPRGIKYTKHRTNKRRTFTTTDGSLTLIVIHTHTHTQELIEFYISYVLIFYIFSL